MLGTLPVSPRWATAKENDRGGEDHPEFLVTKNGKFVGNPFESRDEAEQIAEMEKLADPSAVVQY